MILLNYRIKIIKYLITVILLFLGTVTVCELTILDMENAIVSEPSICFKKPDDKNSFISDMKRLSEENNLIIYTSEENYESSNCVSTSIRYISCEKEYIQKYFGIKRNEFKSIFYNKVIFDIDKMTSDLMIGDNTCFYMIGSEENVMSFYKSIKKDYDISSCNLNSENRSVVKIINYIAWLVITLLIFMITMYDVNVNKKEAFIKIVFGESRLKSALINILIDVAIYVFIWILAMLVLSSVTCVQSGFGFLSIAFIIFCMVNILPYFTLVRFDSDILAKDRFSQKSLLYNSIFIFLTAFMSICIIIATINISGTLGEYIKLDSYIKNYGKYSTCDFQIYKRDGITAGSVYETKKIDDVLNEKIYRKYFKKLNPIIMTKTSDGYIYANVNAYNYISDNIEEFKSADISSDICIIVPGSLSESEKRLVVDDALDIVRTTEGKKFDFTYQTVEYQDNAELITLIDLDEKGIEFFEINKNPVIIYNAIMADTLTTPVNETDRSGYMAKILYMIDSKQLDNIKEYFYLQNEKCSVTNIGEYYKHRLTYIRKTTCLVYFATIVILLMEVLVNITVVVLNYKIHAVELALKKVFGYSVFQKNIKLIILSLSGVIFSILINYLIFSTYQVFGVGLIVLLFISASVLLQIRNSEKKNVSEVIKRK